MTTVSIHIANFRFKKNYAKFVQIYIVIYFFYIDSIEGRLLK